MYCRNTDAKLHDNCAVQYAMHSLIAPFIGKSTACWKSIQNISYRMMKPPKTRPWMLRCCGWQTKVFCIAVSWINMALPEVRDGMSVIALASASSSSAHFLFAAVSAVLQRLQSHDAVLQACTTSTMRFDAEDCKIATYLWMQGRRNAEKRAITVVFGVPCLGHILENHAHSNPGSELPSCWPAADAFRAALRASATCCRSSNSCFSSEV